MDNIIGINETKRKMGQSEYSRTACARSLGENPHLCDDEKVEIRIIRIGFKWLEYSPLSMLEKLLAKSPSHVS